MNSSGSLVANPLQQKGYFMSESPSIRPVRIYFAMGDKNLVRSINRFLPAMGESATHTCVKNVSDADLIVFIDIESAVAGKAYFKSIQAPDKPKKPINGFVVDPSHLLTSLASEIATTRKRLWST